MIIFIDFDDVLFNTRDFKVDYVKIFEKNGFSKEIFYKYYYDKPSELGDKRLKKYDPQIQIRKIRDETRADTKNLQQDIKNFLDTAHKYLFSDSIRFLDYFENSDIYIISYGKKPFQQMKIGGCEIKGYCRKIEITDQMKSHSIRKLIGTSENLEKNVFFIEDRVEQIEDVKKAFPKMKTILVKRPEGRYQDKKNTYCDYQVQDLDEAKKIIESKIN